MRGTAKRTVNTYVALAEASARMLTNAKATEEGCAYNIMGSMLFCAFCLEAYLNHLGSNVQAGWDIVERKLSPHEKLDLLSQAIGYKLDKGCRPFQTFREAFKFRDALVHAKPFSAHAPVRSGVIPPISDEAPEELKARWEKWVTLEKAQRFYDDTLKMIEILHCKAFDNEQVDWTLSFTLWSVPMK